MLDFADLSTETVAATIGGKPYSFPMLKRKQIGDLMAKWAAADRGALLKQCQEAGATSAERLEAIHAYDGNAKLLSFFVAGLSNVEHCQEVLVASLGAAATAIEIHPTAVKRLALHVAGFGEYDAAESDADEEKPNPKA